MTKDKLLQVRVSTEQHERLKVLAKAARTSVSDYVRARALEGFTPNPEVIGRTEDGHDIVKLPPEEAPDPRLAAEPLVCPRCKADVTATQKQCRVCSWPLKKKG